MTNAQIKETQRKQKIYSECERMTPGETWTVKRFAGASRLIVDSRSNSFLDMVSRRWVNMPPTVTYYDGLLLCRGPYRLIPDAAMSIPETLVEGQALASILAPKGEKSLWGKIPKWLIGKPWDSRVALDGVWGNGSALFGGFAPPEFTQTIQPDFPSRLWEGGGWIDCKIDHVSEFHGERFIMFNNGRVVPLEVLNFILPHTRGVVSFSFREGVLVMSQEGVAVAVMVFNEGVEARANTTLPYRMPKQRKGETPLRPLPSSQLAAKAA